ncbi:MAG: hypothetical protein OEY51_08665, partial [Cyclobacteriaceae bacterium]|nr:hypothetical protein [Cyclobacteriaceae bacterium]
EVLKPLTIEDARANFRFLSITSAIQKLKFTRVAATGLEEKEISAVDRPFPVKGHPLPSTNAFLAEYGDSLVNRGSNAIIIRSFKGPRGIGPAVTLQLGPYKGVFPGDDGEDTRLLLVPDKESITLSPGDRFEIEGYWLPYGDKNSTETPREEVERYGHHSPRVVDVKKGTVLSPFPATLKAEGNEAIFSIEGGKGLLPVVVSGLTEWKNPAIFIKENDTWQPVSHHRNTKYDGNQVFSEGGGTFGAVFLVHSNEEKISLKVTGGIPLPDMKKLVLSVADHNPTTVSFKSANNNIEGLLKFPGHEPRQPFSWQNSEANSLWFEQKEEGWIRGGRITPNEEDIDIEYWWQNKDEDMNMPDQEFTLDVSGSKYFDGEQPYILRAGGWEKLTGSASHSEAAIAWVSADKKFITAMAWTNAEIAFTDENNRGSIRLTSKAFPADKRFFVRGKVYHFEGNLEQLAGRIRREMF